NLLRSCPLPGPHSHPQNWPGKTRSPGCFADLPIFHLAARGTIVERSEGKGKTLPAEAALPRATREIQGASVDLKGVRQSSPPKSKKSPTSSKTSPRSSAPSATSSTSSERTRPPSTPAASPPIAPPYREKA